MHRRLALFAVYFHWRPADVWALTADEWVLLARQVDVLHERD